MKFICLVYITAYFQNMHFLFLQIAMNDSLDRAFRTFNGLIQNKTFLLLFIRTLENQKEFSMREKVNVASLISVALQGRMDYHTE